MAEGGTLLIKTKRVGEEILVSVEDSGSGIAEESKGKIFDPFFTTKEVGKGTGLGLSVTYGIIQEHRGTIIVESPVAHRPVHQTSPGTAFHLRLPAIDNSAGRET
jgi:signal transduction histidine kinase